MISVYAKQIDAERAELRFNYDEQAVASVRGILGARFQKRRKVWIVPVISLCFVERLKGIKLLGDRQLRETLTTYKRAMYASIVLKEDTGPVEPYEGDLAFLNKHEHQVRGVRWMLPELEDLGGSLLADDVGLGKTAMAIACAWSLLRCEKVLVICPSQLTFQWAREFKKFLGLDTTVINGPGDKRDALWQAGAPGVAIVSQDILRTEIDRCPREWDMIIRDEATAFKTPTAARTKACKKLSARYRLDLTGTPIETNLLEFRTLMSDWLCPGLLGTDYQFRQKYVITGWGGEIRGYRDTENLKVRYDPFFLRRTAELLKLPECLVIERAVQMKPDEAREYKKLAGEAKDKLHEAENHFAVGASIMELRKFTSYPPMLGFDEPGAKFRALQELHMELTEAGHRLLVFTFFRRTAEAIAEHFNAPLALGGMSSKSKDAMVRDCVKGLWPMLVTTDVLQKGVDGLQEVMDCIVHFDALWNPAAMRQRDGRIDRRGQEKVTRSFRLILSDTVDERVYELLHERGELFDDMLDGEMPRWTRAKWESLL